MALKAAVFSAEAFPIKANDYTSKWNPIGKNHRVTPVEFVTHSPGESMVIEIAAVMSAVHPWVFSTSRTKNR